MVFSSAWVQYKIILYQKKLKSKLRNSIKVIAKDCPDPRIKKFKLNGHLVIWSKPSLMNVHVMHFDDFVENILSSQSSLKKLKKFARHRVQAPYLWTT